MNKEAKELIDTLKDSVKNPIVLVPTFDGSDEEPIDNDQCLTPNECKILLDYINQLETNKDVLKEYIQDLRYNIEPEGVRINFNCEYDSEEDYIRGMEEQAQLEILKAILSKMQELERSKENV